MTSEDLLAKQKAAQEVLDAVNAEIDEVKNAERNAKRAEYPLGNVYQVYGRKYTVVGYTEDGVKIMRDDIKAMDYTFGMIESYSPELLGNIPQESLNLMF